MSAKIFLVLILKVKIRKKNVQIFMQILVLWIKNKCNSIYKDFIYKKNTETKNKNTSTYTDQ